MSRRAVDEDSWEGDDDGWDGDESLEDLENLGADDETPTVPCTHCKRPIPEDVPRCPYCDNYPSAEDAASSRKPWWIIVGALFVLYIVYRWIAK